MQIYGGLSAPYRVILCQQVHVICVKCVDVECVVVCVKLFVCRARLYWEHRLRHQNFFVDNPDSH